MANGFTTWCYQLSTCISECAAFSTSSNQVVWRGRYSSVGCSKAPTTSTTHSNITSQKLTIKGVNISNACRLNHRRRLDFILLTIRNRRHNWRCKLNRNRLGNRAIRLTINIESTRWASNIIKVEWLQVVPAV